MSFVAIGYLVYLFSGGLTPKAQAQTVQGPKPVQTVTTILEPGKPAVTIVEGAAPKVADAGKPEKSEKPEKRGEEWDMPDLVTELTKDHRIRLAGVIRTTKKSVVTLEWRDGSMKVVDSLSGDNLKMLGWAVMLSEDDRMVILARPGYRYIATAWEVPQPVAKASDETQQQIRRESRAMGAAASDTSEGGGGRAARIEPPASLSPDKPKA